MLPAGYIVSWKRRGRTVYGVTIKVTWSDIKQRQFCHITRPGVYVFRGYWYGTDPTDYRSFGKFEGAAGKLVCKVKSHQQVKKLVD